MDTRLKRRISWLCEETRAIFLECIELTVDKVQSDAFKCGWDENQLLFRLVFRCWCHPIC